jgi:hypothetical protein
MRVTAGAARRAGCTAPPNDPISGLADIPSVHYNDVGRE